MGKLRILNKIRDLTDVDKRHVFDDPFRYKVISPFRVISLVEVLNNANGMRQVNGEGVAGDNFAQPANDNQFPPGPGDDGFPPAPAPGPAPDSYFSGNSAYTFPDDDVPPHSPDTDEANQDAYDAELEHRLDLYEIAGVQNLIPPDVTREQHRIHMERMKEELNELKRSVEQTAPEVVAATLPKIYAPVVFAVENARSLPKEQREEIEDLSRDVMDEVDDKLDDADADDEIRELNDSLGQLTLDIATDQDQGKVEWDKTNVVNQMQAIEDKVNESNERNAQILSGSSGQEVNPIKVEVKVEVKPDTTASEFVKNVNKASNELIKQQQITNEYYASRATDEKERKMFEDKNNELQRSQRVRYVHGSPATPRSAPPRFVRPPSPPSSVPGTPLTSGVRLGLDMDDLKRGQRQSIYDFIDNRQPEPQGTLPLQAPVQAPGNTVPPAETVQEPVGNVQRGVRRRMFDPTGLDNGPPSPILFDGSHVVVGDDRLQEIRENVKIVTKAAPLTYDQYKAYLRSFNLNEYFDENEECEYFYHRFQILSNEFPENIQMSNERSIVIPKRIDDKMKNTINVAISLYLFKPLFSTSTEPLYAYRKNFLKLIVLLDKNEYLTEEYEEEERPIFIDVVRIGKLMEEYGKTESSVDSFFLKLSKSEFARRDSDSDQEMLNMYNEIDDYIEQFEQIEDNQGTETYRDYLHSTALTALSLFGPDEPVELVEPVEPVEPDEHARGRGDPDSREAHASQNQSDQFVHRSDHNFYPWSYAWRGNRNSKDGMDRWGEEQYYHDYVQGWED